MWWKPIDSISSSHYVRGAGAVSNRKSASVTISTEAPPPISLEVEPGNEASQDDISLNDILDHQCYKIIKS